MRHGRLGVIWALLLGCGGADPAATRPECDAAEVVSTVRGIADTHPGYQPRIPARTSALVGVRETVAREVDGDYERLCVGTLELANGDRFEMSWQILTSGSLFGTVWNITPCYGPYDPEGRDCLASAEGR